MVTVTVRPRSLDIGTSTYPLANIARVATHIRKRKYILKTVFGVFFVLNIKTVPLLAMFGAFLLWRAWLAYSSPLHVLSIETSGVPQDLLASNEESEIRTLKDALVDYIEEPPDRPVHIEVHNATTIGSQNNQFGFGDQFNIFGRNNIGRTN